MKPPSPTSTESETGLLLAALKELLRGRRVSYQMIADAMGISLPTVKRMLNKTSLPLDRLVGVCQVAGIEPAELFALAERQRPRHTIFTAEQDHLFDEHPEFLTYFSRLIDDGMTPAEIETAEGLSANSTERYLVRLAKVGLLERETGTKIRLKVSTPLGFGPKSKVLRKEHAAFLNRVVKQVLAGGSEDVFAILKPLRLERALYREMVQELTAIVDKYSHLSSRAGSREAGSHLKLAIATGPGEPEERAPIVDLD